MMTREEADLALAALSKDVGIAQIKLDQADTALLAFGDNHELIFHYVADAKRFQFWAPLHDVTLANKSDEDLALLRHMLQRNFPSTKLEGSYFAIDGEIGVALLGRVVPVEMSALAAFSETAKSFAQQVMLIAASLREDIAKETASVAPATPEIGDGSMIRV